MERERQREAQEGPVRTAIEEAGKSVARFPGRLVEGAGGLLQILGAGVGAVAPGIESSQGAAPGRAVAEFGRSIGAEAEDL